MWQNRNAEHKNLSRSDGLKNSKRDNAIDALSSELIDGGSCYIDVGFSYPGRAEASKGAGVHRLKGIMSWVQNAVRQFV